MNAGDGPAALVARHADRVSPIAGAMSHRAVAPAARPLWLTAAGQSCLAWWHAPAAAADGGESPALPLAVVLAGSWGEEDVASYDRLRALAVALAEGGLGTLRFEWPDTGDSSAATGATTVADALAAFDAAAAQALVSSGHARLAFVGLRLGALLAAHAAIARQDVDALVALLPVTGGRGFVREQHARDIRLPARAPSGTVAALFDAAELPVSLGGFALSVRRLEALSVLKWPSAATTSVLEALVLRSAQSPQRTAADALARMGARVRDWAHEGLDGVVAAADEPSALAPAVAEIVRWLRERAVDETVTRGVPTIENFGVADPGNGQIHAALASARLEAATAAVLALSAAEAPEWMRLRVGAIALRERVVLLHEPRKPVLAGVLGERDAGAAGIDRPPRRAIVLLSSGRERRIGPQRAWVNWARHRAALGDLTLRLDLSGAGDSAATPDPRHRVGPDDARAIEDMGRAVAWLRREHGVRDCTIVGAGLGASHAWRAALAGIDVQRVVAIDPTDLHGRAPERTSTGTPAAASRVRRMLHRWSRDVGRLLRKTHRDELAADAAQASARGVSLHVVCATRERALALVRQAMGRRGSDLVRERRLAIVDLAVADPAFASPAGRDDLCRRLDALLQPASGAATAPPWRAVKVAA